MKITLIVVGKTTDSSLAGMISDYCSRVQHYARFEMVVLPELKNAKNLTQSQQKQIEGEAILRALGTAYTVLLDEHGREYRSIEFAKYIDKLMTNIGKDIAFVIGGPYGFSEAVYARAEAQLSLSQMTFSHQMIRLLFVEQLYRAMTILRGEPYHHE